MRVTIVGRGRVGRALARALRPTRHRVRLRAGRGRGTGDDVIVLAVPDPVVGEVASRLELGPEQCVLHCSGSLDADVLPNEVRGVMHPLASFAAPACPPDLRGVTFVIAGHERAVRRATAIAKAVGARAVIANVHGPAYHAAAALSANGAAALASVAVRVMASIGMTREEAQRAVGALLRSVGENVERVGVPEALSGPVIRGDDETVYRHRVALEREDAGARAAYDAIAPAILDCARRAGLPEERVTAVLRALRRRNL